MRISIVGPAWPLRGGIAHHVYWLRQQLLARGHKVQVVSFRKLYPGIFFPGATEYDNSRFRLDADALSILAPLNPLTWIRAFKRIKSFSPDVIVFQWWQPFFAPVVGSLVRAFRKSRLKCVIECHNVFPHEGTPFDRLLVAFALSPADHLITHSTKDREELSAIVPDKTVSVSPLPVLKEFYSSHNPDRSGRNILFFGKVRKYKGLDVLLAAMPKVLSRVECTLTVIGEFYDSIDKYRRLVREYGIETSVQMENRYVANEEVPGIFERADVLVLPYRSATQSAVARIALSNGLPVIASRTGGLSEAVTDNANGLLFPPGDAEALADQLVAYFTTGLGPVFVKNILASNDPGCEIVEIIERAASFNATLAQC